jgi:hypothetical protein
MGFKLSTASLNFYVGKRHSLPGIIEQGMCPDSSSHELFGKLSLADSSEKPADIWKYVFVQNLSSSFRPARLKRERPPRLTSSFKCRARVYLLLAQVKLRQWPARVALQPLTPVAYFFSDPDPGRRNFARIVVGGGIS